MTLNYTGKDIWGREVDRSDTLNFYGEEEVKKALRYVKTHYDACLHFDNVKHTTIYWDSPEDFEASIITVVERPERHVEDKYKTLWAEMKKKLQY